MRKLLSLLLSVPFRRPKVRSQVNLQEVYELFASKSHDDRPKTFIMKEDYTKNKIKLILGYIDEDGGMVGDPSAWITESLSEDLITLFNEKKMIVLTYRKE